MATTALSKLCESVNQVLKRRAASRSDTFGQSRTRGLGRLVLGSSFVCQGVYLTYKLAREVGALKTYALLVSTSFSLFPSASLWWRYSPFRNALAEQHPFPRAIADLADLNARVAEATIEVDQATEALSLTLARQILNSVSRIQVEGILRDLGCQALILELQKHARPVLTILDDFRNVALSEASIDLREAIIARQALHLEWRDNSYRRRSLLLDVKDLLIISLEIFLDFPDFPRLVGDGIEPALLLVQAESAFSLAQDRLLDAILDTVIERNNLKQLVEQRRTKQRRNTVAEFEREVEEPDGRKVQ
ncbi:hypothetical protein JCM8547_002655 [Rhodosporidiobolus lusitaniae]